MNAMENCVIRKKKKEYIMYIATGKFTKPPNYCIGYKWYDVCVLTIQTFK